MIQDRYPDADILAQRGHWDDATREVILDRVHNVPNYRFFDEQERETLLALCARIVPQDHHLPERRVPIAPWIDQRCAERFIDGFRFDDMPDESTAWRWGLAGLDETARTLYGRRFVDLSDDERDATLREIDGEHPAGDTWTRMPPRRWLRTVAIRQIAGIYYAHPIAWDEIGFGGPAYPRGYAALNHGAPEPWEAQEADEERR